MFFLLLANYIIHCIATIANTPITYETPNGNIILEFWPIFQIRLRNILKEKEKEHE